MVGSGALPSDGVVVQNLYARLGRRSVRVMRDEGAWRGF